MTYGNIILVAASESSHPGWPNTYIFDISTLDISDINRISYYDATYGGVPIVSDQEFLTVKGIYIPLVNVQANVLMAHVSNLSSGGNTKLVLEIFRGSNKPYASQTTLFVYPRNPVKATSDSTKIDLPEEFVPIAEDVATVMILRKMGKSPPVDMEQRVTGIVQSQLAQIGVTVSPSRS